MVATGSVVQGNVLASSRLHVVGKGTGEGGDRCAREGRQAVSPSGADVGSAEVEEGQCSRLVQTENGAAMPDEH